MAKDIVIHASEKVNSVDKEKSIGDERIWKE